MNLYQHKVQYYETDKMGIVHHSNYIRWFEEARMAFMEDLGLPYKAMEAAQVWVPVLKAECEYKFPVRFDETLVLELEIRGYNGVRFDVSYTGYNKETGKLSCVGVTKHCFTTPALRPIRLKQNYPAWHEAFLQASSEE